MSIFSSTFQGKSIFKDFSSLCEPCAGGSRISGKGVCMHKGVCVGGGGVRFADFISIFLISHENEIIRSQRDQFISFSWDI